MFSIIKLRSLSSRAIYQELIVVANMLADTANSNLIKEAFKNKFGAKANSAEEKATPTHGINTAMIHFFIDILNNFFAHKIRPKEHITMVIMKAIPMLVGAKPIFKKNHPKGNVRSKIVPMVA